MSLSALFASSLCHCSLLFDLSTLDEPDGAATNGDGSSGEPGRDGGNGDSALDSATDATESLPDANGMDGAAHESGEDAEAAFPDASVDSGGRDAGVRDAGARDSSIADTGASASEGGPSDAADSGSSCMQYVLTPTGASASTTRGMNVQGNAIDENFATRWESIQSLDVDGASVDPQWLDLDFGQAMFIGQVQIDWEDSCAKDYSLQTSMDQATWTTMPNGTITGNSTSSLGAPSSWVPSVDTTGLSGTGRYLRVNMTARCNEMYGYSIWEMRVFGHPAGSCN